MNTVLCGACAKTRVTIKMTLENIKLPSMNFSRFYLVNDKPSGKWGKCWSLVLEGSGSWKRPIKGSQNIFRDVMRDMLKKWFNKLFQNLIRYEIEFQLSWMILDAFAHYPFWIIKWCTRRTYIDSERSERATVSWKMRWVWVGGATWIYRISSIRTVLVSLVECEKTSARKTCFMQKKEDISFVLFDANGSCYLHFCCLKVLVEDK